MLLINFGLMSSFHLISSMQLVNSYLLYVTDMFIIIL